MLTDNLLVLKNATLVMAIGWTIIIAFLCLIKVNDLPSLGFSISNFDKYVHFTFHFVFTMLWGFYSWQKNNKIDIKNISNIIIISFCYGILIEIMQELFTTTRHADVKDVIANCSGAILAFGLLAVIKKAEVK